MTRDDVVDAELVDQDDAPAPGAELAVADNAGGRAAARAVARAAKRGDDVGPATIDMPLLPAYVDDVDPDELVPLEVDDALAEAIPENTRETYEYQWARFVRWCGRQGREHLPATVGTVRFYVWAHYTMTDKNGKLRGRRGRPYAPATVSTALGVVCAVQQWHGYPSPWKHPAVRKQFKAYEKKWLQAGHKPDVAYAPTLDEAIAMRRACDLTTCAGLRDAAMIALQFSTGMRASELCALDVDDLSFESSTRMVVRIRWSKAQKPRKVYVEADRKYAPDVDVITLVNEWMELRAARGHDPRKGPLWLNIRSGKRRLVGHSGKIMETRVDRHAYEAIHAKAGKLSGVDRDPRTGERRILVTHSERAAFITNASDAGVPLERVGEVTGHAKGSSVIFRYYRSGQKWGEYNPNAATIRVADLRRRRRRDDGDQDDDDDG